MRPTSPVGPRPPPTPPSPLEPLSPPGGPDLALDELDVTELALAAGLLVPPGPVTGDSSEDEEGARGGPRGRYYRFARTVVTREPPPPSPCPLPLPHIDQLDGVDDGDKGARGRRDGAPPVPPPPPPPPVPPPAAEDLPSDIVDFVLKNMARDGAKASATRPAGAGVNGDSGGGAQWVTEEPARRPAGGWGARDGHPGVPRGGDAEAGDGGGAYGDVTGGRGTRGGGTHGRIVDGHRLLGDATNGHATREDATRRDPTHKGVTPGDPTHEDVAHHNGTHGRHHADAARRGATFCASTHGRVTRLSATRHSAALGEAAWGAPWGPAGAPNTQGGAPSTQGGAPKRPGETLGPGAKRPKLEATDDEEGDTKDALATG